MHIVEGVLSTPVLVGGAILATAGVAYGLKRLNHEALPQVGVLAAVFFVASYIHLPVGFSSVHLILNGLVGLLLGWAAFPALLVALLLQAVFFGFGGFLVLGVNTFNIAFPAVISAMLFAKWVQGKSDKMAFIGGFLVGAVAILLSTLLVAFSLALSGEAFILAAKLTFLAHIPIMIIEGFVTAFAVMLLHRVKPEALTEVMK